MQDILSNSLLFSIVSCLVYISKEGERVGGRRSYWPHAAP